MNNSVPTKFFTEDDPPAYVLWGSIIGMVVLSMVKVALS
ncbi:hypothetical protein FDI85_gp116 [Erwinia phage Machina]|jgi:hypothetical protein|uniref:Uncharacterized protein n=2 Tax=Machinavirus machina TaxID=2169990 RepID=A0A1B2ID90_9CAUD|nr:hypothetical protein BIZ81_gp115 [Erwinia phage vB_EamM_Huxley]YP_009617085.1 hypothetical protein FDI85_gp116 [Erwinia phage Machina]ANZ49250.1 hypothetical protein HUXLEY_168 [Erwinia phage vB_EamM_Huxley]ANZ49806.1 hypothetical protein MACHINA_168 [Erwinia phage Machina]ANZ50078.1 hypothetical protein PARSHIK_169 [Erwinia phage vB_EamM_Parshik]